MILRERIIRWMYEHGKPVSRAHIHAKFPESYNSTKSAIENLMYMGHIQTVENQICEFTKTRRAHYMLTKKGINSIIKPKGKERYGDFYIRRAASGYEYLNADPISTYIDPTYLVEVKRYPAGYALGVAPQGSVRV